MNASPGISRAADKLLFTPGPLTTSHSVKAAMLHDAGSWHSEFNEVVRQTRESLLEVAGVSTEQGFESILMQGSGTFGIEAVLASAIPPNGKLLVVSNVAHGERMIQMARQLRISVEVLRVSELECPDPDEIEKVLLRDSAITHVAVVHCETTTGILNPIEAIGRVVRSAGRQFIVDAMSSFGAIPIDLEDVGVDYLISSPNKCIEGVPGFSFVIARRAQLLATEGFARSFSLDLLSQWKGFERNGQFRSTPPTHVILAFRQALNELAAEGGVAARGDRYRTNHQTLIAGMKRLGFTPVLDAARQSFIITSFYFLQDPRFEFGLFYRGLSDQGMIIYPGKLTEIDCFRIGSIGRIYPSDLHNLVGAIERVLRSMGVALAPLVG